MVYGRYKLPNGKWQTWAEFETIEEARDVLKFHAQGREIQIQEKK